MTKNSLLKCFVVYMICCFIFTPFVYAQDSFGQALGERRSLINVKKRNVGSFGAIDGRDPVGRGINEDSLTLSSIPPLGPGSLQSTYYTIHVLGEVARPGTYKILPSDRVDAALKYAGNISRNGSERGIELRRGKDKKVIDLFNYKYNAALDQNPYLMENDVIFVPVKKGEFEIEGPVNRPGNYEIVKDISLKKAIRLAGGLSTGLSKKDTIKIVRYNSYGKKEILSIPNEDAELNEVLVRKGDVIVIPHILIADKEFDYNLQRIPGDNIFYPTIDDNVYVIGAVSLPGPYEFKPHYTYREYVNLSGPIKDAKMRNIQILRPNGSKVKAKNSISINAGDTIIVPQRYWKAETVLAWLNTLMSSTTATLLLYDNIHNR